jgi:hypothetical protein
LGDAVGVVDGVGLAPEVDQGDEHLAAVVGIDGARGVGDGDAVLGREVGAGADLAFEAVGDGDGEAGGILRMWPGRMETVGPSSSRLSNQTQPPSGFVDG